MSTRLIGSSEPVGRTGTVDSIGTSAGTRRPLRRTLMIVAGALVLFMVGTATGWLVRGGDESSSPSYVMGGAVIVGDELTERQLEMVDIARQYVEAFIAKDGNAVVSFMVPDGYVALPTLGDRVLRANDGSLQEWVEGLGIIPNELNDPIVVRDAQVVLTGHHDELGTDWMMVIEFTDSGDVEIVSDTHWAN